jgi:hypothetical protein
LKDAILPYFIAVAEAICLAERTPVQMAILVKRQALSGKQCAERVC